MNHDLIRNYTSPDQEIFTQIMKHYGYTSAAVYRVVGKSLNLIISTEPDTTVPWPASVSFSIDYTPRRGRGLHLGWVKPSFSQETKKFWPRAVSFYQPAQDCSLVKLIFVVKNARGKRTKVGDLDGPLEAMTAKIAYWIDQSETRLFLGEAHFIEQMKMVNVDVQALINDHLKKSLVEISNFCRPFVEKKGEQSIGLAIESIDAGLNKLSQAFDTHLGNLNVQDMSELKLDNLCGDLVARLKNLIDEQVAETKSSTMNVSLRAPSDRTFLIEGIGKLIDSSIWEVLKNAVFHSSGSQINLTLYDSDNMVVLDIEDDGQGVPQGSEDLIFLRFFQAPTEKSPRKLQRNLGIGLFLARNITEQHGGSLSFIRGVGKNGVFRFMWPRKTAKNNDDDSKLGSTMKVSDAS